MQKEIKEKNDADLATLLSLKREELRVLRFGTAGSQTRDVRTTRKTRRNVARILTEMKVRATK